jgi:preprotein translocase subunit YajC
MAPLFSPDGMYGWSLLVSLTFTFLLISHVIWLGIILLFWWRNQRKQERIWQST